MDDPDELSIDHTVEGDAAILRLAGEIDIASRAALADAAHAAVADGAARLIIDMSAVTFMDSSGIAALIETNAVAPVVLRKPSVAVARLIEMTGLTETFAIEP